MLWDLIRNVNKKYSVTVFLTTHYMEEADQLCHRIAIIDRVDSRLKGLWRTYLSPCRVRSELRGWET